MRTTKERELLITCLRAKEGKKGQQLAHGKLNDRMRQNERQNERTEYSWRPLREDSCTKVALVRQQQQQQSKHELPLAIVRSLCRCSKRSVTTLRLCDSFIRRDLSVCCSAGVIGAAAAAGTGPPEHTLKHTH